MNRGILVSPFHAESERMAWTLVTMLRRWNQDIPVLVLGQDYLCGRDWRTLGRVSVRTRRAAGAHGSPLQWFNKLGAISLMPFEETLYLDCDILPLSDPAWWFDYLGTDDLTFFTTWQDPGVFPDETQTNLANPHRMRERLGVPRSPVIDSAGHFFVRRTDRAGALLQRIKEIMQESLSRGPDSLYQQMAGPGNVPASDELAASIMMVEQSVKLPDPWPGRDKPLGIFLPPWQSREVFDFARGVAEFDCVWSGKRLTPGAVHFAAGGKHHPAYQQWIGRCCAAAGPA